MAQTLNPEPEHEEPREAGSHPDLLPIRGDDGLLVCINGRLMVRFLCLGLLVMGRWSGLGGLLTRYDGSRLVRSLFLKLKLRQILFLPVSLAVCNAGRLLLLLQGLD